MILVFKYSFLVRCFCLHSSTFFSIRLFIPFISTIAHSVIFNAYNKNLHNKTLIQFQQILLRIPWR